MNNIQIKMLNGNKKNLDIPNILTVLSIYGTVYGFVYKAVFFESLDLTWYVKTLPLQNLVMSSIEVIIVTGISIFLALVIHVEIFEKLNKKNIFYMLIPWLFATTLAFLTTYIMYTPRYIPHFKFIALSLTGITFTLSILICKRDEEINKMLIQPKSHRLVNSIFSKLGIVIAIGILIYLPIQLAKSEARLVSTYPRAYLPLTSEPDGFWYILDINNNNALLIKTKIGSEEKKYKIKELKELGIIDTSRIRVNSNK